MAQYKDTSDKRKTSASKDIALDKLGYHEGHKSKKKEDKIKGRPKGFFRRFAQAAFPQKDDTGGEKVRKVVFIAAVAVFCCTLAIPIWQLLSMNNAEDTNSKIAELAGVTSDIIDTDRFEHQPFGTNTTSSEVIPEESEEINVTPLTNTPLDIDFASLKEVNRDTRAWVKITGTYINNVVVVGEDDDYYLTHDFYGNESISGTVFSTYRNKWDGTDDNLILHGHNMISGQFFAALGHYIPNDASREPCAFYKVHPTVMLATPEGGSETYKIFAGIMVNTEPRYGEVFKFYKKTKFADAEDFNNYIIEVMDRSWFYTDVDLTYGDDILTLSTCYNSPLGEEVDTRWVIFARKVRPGESEYVDVSVAKRNYGAKLFDYYYSVIGGQWYGSNWDTSKLLSY